MTTTPTGDGDTTQTPTTQTTQYAAGLGVVAAYGSDVTAPGSTAEAPAKYTAGNQVQSA